MSEVEEEEGLEEAFIVVAVCFFRVHVPSSARLNAKRRPSWVAALYFFFSKVSAGNLFMFFHQTSSRYFSSLAQLFRRACAVSSPNPSFFAALHFASARTGKAATLPLALRSAVRVYSVRS